MRVRYQELQRPSFVSLFVCLPFAHEKNCYLPLGHPRIIFAFRIDEILFSMGGKVRNLMFINLELNFN